MKRIFRSIINIKKNGVPTIPLDELAKNYKAFITSRVEAEDPSYIKMYEWIEAHNRAFKELPSIELLFEKAQEEGNETVIANLEEIAPLIAYWGSDYRAVLKTKFEEQNGDEFRRVMEKTWQAVNSELIIKKGRKKKKIKGIQEAISYFHTETRRFLLNALDIKTEGQIKSTIDSKEVITEYEKRKRDPLSNLGLFTFLDKIDDVFRGTKLGDLFIIAAFVAQGKTTLAVNIAYNGIMQGLNGMFVTMEANYKEMRDMFYVIHTCNPDWYEHSKFKNLAGKISYERVRYGELSDLEQEFFEVASQDFAIKDGFGELHLYQPSEHMTPSRFDMELYDRHAELKERGKTLDFVVIDYVGLMIQDKEVRYGDFNVDLNNIIKRLKNTAINFDNGRGLRVITPFQVNRDGWKDALKNDGIYKLTALSNAHEAERSSDGVIALFMTEEMKRNGIMKICCLKHRDGKDFIPFEAHIDFVSRRITDFIQKKVDSHDGMGIKDISTELKID